MEKLKRNNGIEIKLLPNRRFIYANRKSNIVITAENNATEITVLFPDEYEEYSKRVDFINSQGKEWTEGLYTPEFKKYKAGQDKTRFHFSLPTEVTTEGELKMQFLAYLPDESMTTVPFEIIHIDVQNGMLAFKRNSKSNPDLLILAANKSEQALFNSQKAVAKSEKALNISNEAKQAALNAEATSASAFKTAKKAEQSAAQAVNAAVEANEKSDLAVSAAADANAAASAAESNSLKALETASAAKTGAESACGIAGEALANSEQAVNQADAAFTAALQAAGISNQAESIAQNAESIASAAEINSETALQTASEAVDMAGKANNTADEAKNNSEAAVLEAREAKQTAQNAEGLAQSVVDRANAGDFNGAKGDTGDTGPPGKDAVMFATDNLLGFYVDKNGDFYAYAGDNGAVDFRYDENTGELYLVYL